MRKRWRIIVLSVLVLIGLTGVFWSHLSKTPSESNVPETHVPDEVPVKGVPTMVDLGAKECIPCKMMVPVMEKVEKKYKGEAAVIFIDVWKNKKAAKRFGIRAIPTQIFFNKEGKEVHRHQGFMSEEEIDRVFQKMGVG